MKKINKILAILLLCIILTPSTVFAKNNDEISKMNDIKNQLEKYLGTQETGEPFFLREKAIQDGISEV